MSMAMNTTTNQPRTRDDKDRTQTYRGYRIEVSLLGCQVPRIVAFCETVAQAKSHIDSHINTLDARR
jgi:hypothetical protein